MTVDTTHFWWFRELNFALWRLASAPDFDDPHSPGFSVGEDIAQDIDHFWSLINSHYADIIDLDFKSRMVALDRDLDQCSDWSNIAFLTSDFWENVRAASRDIVILRVIS